jgi:hypothetical protein
VSDPITPFRKHYEHSRALGVAGQMEECADYVQHPDVLLTEFLESYYLAEGEADPERQSELDAALEDEIVLESFHDALRLSVLDEQGGIEWVSCAGGAFDPLPTEQHPALRRRGLDYIGLRDGTVRIVLGVQQTEEETAYSLLLRALNCFAEVAPPFQLARLRRRVIRDRAEPDASFDLQIACSRQPAEAAERALWQLTRDLAEAFKTRILQDPQFAGTLGWIELVQLGGEVDGPSVSMRRDWRV